MGYVPNRETRKRAGTVQARDAFIAMTDKQDKEFYASSNGDTWSLSRDPASGRLAVMHQPNANSGGNRSYTNVDEFLRTSPAGP